MSQQWTGVEVQTSFFPLSFFLYMCTPTIMIDGQAVRRPWGRHYFPLPPGSHNIKIYFRYLFMDTCGANQIDVTVHPGYVNRVTYTMPPWMLAKGSIRELQPYKPG